MRHITRKGVAIALAFGTNPTTADSAAQSLNGLLLGYAITVPALDSAATVTLNIKDADGNVIYTKAAIAQNQTTFQSLTGTNAIPLSGNVTFEVVTSASQSHNFNFTVTPTIDTLS